MLTRLLGFAFLMAMITPAAAQERPEFGVGDVLFIFLMGLVILAIVGAIGWVVESEIASSRPPPPPPPSPEDYDQVATVNRARARAADAQAAYDDSRARAALKREELNEIEDFIKEQRARRAGGNAGRQ